MCNVSLVKNMVNVGSVCTCSRMSRAILLVDGPLENSEGKVLDLVTIDSIYLSYCSKLC